MSSATYYLRESIKYSYAGVQLVSDGIELGSSLYFETGSLAFATLLGFTSGCLSFVTTRYFQGSEIDNYFASEYGLKNDNQKSQQADNNLLAWLYTVGRSIQKVGDNYFQMQAMIAWYQAFQSNRYIQLQRLPTPVFLMVLAYTAICNIPFMLSNEIHECCEHISPTGAQNKTLPTHKLLKPFSNLGEAFNKTVVWLGSITHSIESLTSLFMVIPPQTMVRLFQLSQFYILLGLSGLGGVAALFFTVHLIQTLFFEGHYSTENLSDITGEHCEEPEIENDTQYHILNATTKLLWTQSLLHAIDDALPIVALTATLGFGPAAYALGIIATTISYFGTQMSEVYRATKESRKVLSDYTDKHPLLLNEKLADKAEKDSTEIFLTPKG